MGPPLQPGEAVEGEADEGGGEDRSVRDNPEHHGRHTTTFSKDSKTLRRFDDSSMGYTPEDAARQPVPGEELVQSDVEVVGDRTCAAQSLHTRQHSLHTRYR